MGQSLQVIGSCKIAIVLSCVAGCALLQLYWQRTGFNTLHLEMRQSTSVSYLVVSDTCVSAGDCINGAVHT